MTANLPARISALYENASDAVISDDGLYRYVLWRRWDMQTTYDFLDQRVRHPLVVDMLNPSTADATSPDRTINRLTAYATRLGCGGLIVVNLYAWRSMTPTALTIQDKANVDIVGPENLAWVRRAYRMAKDGLGYVLAAWGSTDAPLMRSRVIDHDEIADQVGVEFRALLTTAGGAPCHPLVRQKVHDQPQPWSLSTT